MVLKELLVWESLLNQNACILEAGRSHIKDQEMCPDNLKYYLSFSTVSTQGM